MNREQILNEIKANLKAAYELADQNSQLIGNSQMKIHIGSIMNKWLGGIHSDGVAVQAQAIKKDQKVFTPTKDSFQKKTDIKKNRVVVNQDDELSKLSLSELKMKAKEMKLKYTKLNAPQLIELIKFAKVGEKVTVAATTHDEEE